MKYIFYVILTILIGIASGFAGSKLFDNTFMLLAFSVVGAALTIFIILYINSFIVEYGKRKRLAQVKEGKL